MFWEKERKSIPMKVKRQVYERAKGKCEKCGTRLNMNEGDFHHTRDPTVIPRPKTVRFLCPLCHRRYGHKRITRKRETLFGTEKETNIVRQEVVKIKKPAKKKPKARRVAIRGLFGEVVGYRTVKVRKSTTRKKTPTKRKGKRKTISSRKTTKSKRTTKKKTKPKTTTRKKKATKSKTSKRRRKKG